MTGERYSELFKYDVPLDPADKAAVKVPRRDELTRACEALGAERHVNVYAPFQNGKTTFLFQLRHHISGSHPDWECFYLDFSRQDSTKEPRGLERQIVASLIRQLGERDARWTEVLATLCDEEDSEDFWEFAKKVCRHVITEGQILVFLFDEIAGLDAKICVPFLRVLTRINDMDRRQYPEVRRLRFVIAGSVDSVGVMLGENANLSPYDVGEDILLRDFSVADATVFRDAWEESLGLPDGEEVLRLIFEETGGHPYLTQYAFRYAAERMSGKRETSLNKCLEELRDRIAHACMNTTIMQRKIREARRRRWFEWVERVYLHEEIPFARTIPEVFEMYLAGFIREVEGRCEVRNPCYERLVLRVLKEPRQELLRVKAELDALRRATIKARPIWDGADFGRDEELCFVLMPFGPDCDVQNVYSKNVKPVVEKCGLRCERADDIHDVGGVMQSVWENINRARLIVAEMTGRNANVFYELGIAHTLGKTVIMITQDMAHVPSDLRHLRCIVYDYKPELIEDFERALEKTVHTVMSSSPY